MFGLDHAHPIAELFERLPELLSGHPRIFYTLNQDQTFDTRLYRVFGQQAHAARRRNHPTV